jgi:hypothetical protein
MNAQVIAGTKAKTVERTPRMTPMSVAARANSAMGSAASAQEDLPQKLR